MKQVIFLDHHAQILGGGQLSLLELMEHLESCTPRCLCPGGGGLEAALRQQGIAFEETEFPALRLRGIPRVWRALRQLRLRAKAVVLLHANSSRAMFYAGLAGRWAGVPVVWHVRVMQADGRWDWMLALLASRIAVISRAVQARFADMSAAAKTRLIHNGVDLAVFARGDGQGWRCRLGYGAQPLVGMVAQLLPWKRQEDFLQAMAEVGRHCPEAGFVLVGADPDSAGTYERHLRTLAKVLGLGNRVAFLGFCEDIPGIMAMLDVVVLTSDNEPFGRVLIEAMAAAKPVVATAGGGVREIVVDGETGILTPVGGVKEIAVAVEKLLANPEVAKCMGQAGRRRAEAHFSIEAHVAQVEALYEEIWTAHGA